MISSRLPNSLYTWLPSANNLSLNFVPSQQILARAQKEVISSGGLSVTDISQVSVITWTDMYSNNLKPYDRVRQLWFHSAYFHHAISLSNQIHYWSPRIPHLRYITFILHLTTCTPTSAKHLPTGVSFRREKNWEFYFLHLRKHRLDNFVDCSRRQHRLLPFLQGRHKRKTGPGFLSNHGLQSTQSCRKYWYIVLIVEKSLSYKLQFIFIYINS